MCQLKGFTTASKVTPERMTVAYFHQRGFNQGVSDSFTTLRAEYLNGCSSKGSLGMLYGMARWVYRKLKGLRIQDGEIPQAMKEMAAGHAEGFA